MRLASFPRFASLLLLAALTSAAAFAQIRITANIAPPELPVYEQPLCPEDGDLWTPGYWAWDNDYYWVPGTWVMPPEAGYLWTPPYWGWGNDGYLFYDGYWGESMGFYGGIDYGFGYFGNGYYGGHWDRGRFFYNSSLNHLDGNRFHNVYNAHVEEGTASHVGYNGGKGGINAHANAQEEAASHQSHIGATSAQTQHAWTARNNPQQKFSANHGRPAVAATSRADVAAHPKDLPPVEHFAAPNTGNAKADQKQQKQQDKLEAKQTQDRQKLQKQQDKEHQQMVKQNANAARTQQKEQQHQQQTQHMQQGHAQQTQHMQSGGGMRGGGMGGHGGGGGHR